MIKITHGKSDPIALVAKQHWDLINPYVLGANRYSLFSLIHRIETKRDEHVASGKKDRALFYSELLNNDYQLLKDIILCEPLQTKNIITKIEKLHKRYNLVSASSNQKNFGYELLNEVFQYKNWRESEKSFKLLNMLNIEICPYCNLLPVWTDEDRGLTVVSFDHFYDKSTYPYLCLSFYNLIPACQPCNENYKHARKFTIDSHLHPYLDYYNRCNTFDHNYVDDDTDYEIMIEFDKNDLKSQKYNTDFGLLVRYNKGFAKKHAKLIYNITQQYSHSAKNNLVINWGLVTLDEVEKRICKEQEIPFKEESILNEQFGKLRRDFAFKGNLITKTNALLI